MLNTHDVEYHSPMSSISDRFNEALSGRRKSEIARAIGVPPQNLSNWISRNAIPSEHVFAVSKALDINPEWLINGCGEKESSNVVPLTHNNGHLVKMRKIPVVSSTTGGQWEDVVDNFSIGDAERWIDAPDSVSDKSFALVIVGESMQPTIPDGATIIIDPQAHYKHRSIVVVRQNGNSEATCKRLIYDGSTPYLQADNPLYGSPALMDDAVIVGVVKQVVIDL